VSVCAGIEIVLIQKCLQIHAENYTYLQYLHIVIYLHLPAIPTHIHTIPTYTDMSTHTGNTNTYRQYLHILRYLHIHALPAHTVITAHTCNTYTSCVYRHKHYYTYIYMQIHTYTCIYMHKPISEQCVFILLVSGDLSWTKYTHNTCTYMHIPDDTCTYWPIPAYIP
jgi:hypothetical protein